MQYDIFFDITRDCDAAAARVRAGGHLIDPAINEWINSPDPNAAIDAWLSTLNNPKAAATLNKLKSINYGPRVVAIVDAINNNEDLRTVNATNRHHAFSAIADDLEGDTDNFKALWHLGMLDRYTKWHVLPLDDKRLGVLCANKVIRHMHALTRRQADPWYTPERLRMFANMANLALAMSDDLAKDHPALAPHYRDFALIPIRITRMIDMIDISINRDIQMYIVASDGTVNRYVRLLEWYRDHGIEFSMVEAAIETVCARRTLDPMYFSVHVAVVIAACIYNRGDRITTKQFKSAANYILLLSTLQYCGKPACALAKIAVGIINKYDGWKYVNHMTNIGCYQLLVGLAELRDIRACTLLSKISLKADDIARWRAYVADRSKRERERLAQLTK